MKLLSVSVILSWGVKIFHSLFTEDIAFQDIMTSVSFCGLVKEQLDKNHRGSRDHIYEKSRFKLLSAE